jgi:hypothetical protein
MHTKYLTPLFIYLFIYYLLQFSGLYAAGDAVGAPGELPYCLLLKFL